MKEAAAIVKELCLYVPMNSEKDSNPNLRILVRAEKTVRITNLKLSFKNHYPLTIIQHFAHLKK